MVSEEILEKLRRRTVQSFMDILVLTEMKKISLSGYDVMGLIHRRYGFLVSSGTIYSLLYSMERDGLIEGDWNRRKRVYTLTEKGNACMHRQGEESEEFQSPRGDRDGREKTLESDQL